MKSIDTLVEDIHALFDPTASVDVDPEAVRVFSDAVAAAVVRRLGKSEAGGDTLRGSSLGTPCERKLWYREHAKGEGEPLSPSAQLKFLYGDILEELLLFLAETAGHTVEGRQDTVDIHGVVGHRDAIIDGRLVDVKSSSTYGFRKFENNNLREDDPFGYLVQLNAYYHGSLDDPRLTDRGVASFLVIDKTLGHIVLDTYEMVDMDFETIVREKRAMLSKSTPPPRGFHDEPEGKSGNRKLAVSCSYCDFKHTCWPNLQVYLYSTGPTFLTKVEREPKVPRVDTKVQIEV
jgi:hypothetical protein